MTPEEKRDYNAARRRALQRLARMYPDVYEHLVESEMGRPLDKKARTLTQRVKTKETRQR